MGVEIIAAVSDDLTKEDRRRTASRVVEYFSASLPNTRTLVFLDGSDWPDLKATGEENRGMFSPINEVSFRDWRWPFHLLEVLARVDPLTLDLEYACDGLIYFARQFV